MLRLEYDGCVAETTNILNNKTEGKFRIDDAHVLCVSLERVMKEMLQPLEMGKFTLHDGIF